MGAEPGRDPRSSTPGRPNGHDIIGPGTPGTKGMRPPEGTVRGFDKGIELRKGANEIIGMHVQGGHFGRDVKLGQCPRLDDDVVTAGPRRLRQAGWGGLRPRQLLRGEPPTATA